MKFSAARAKFPAPLNALLASLSAFILILAFPDFDLWFLAWFALVPLFFAIEREKQSVIKSFVLGWIFGVTFFFGSCWWLTFAPITYAGVPSIIAYGLLFGATLIVGFFSAIFSALFSLLLKHFGSGAFLFAPFLWTATEFLRFWITGNNWNALGYSQAFQPWIINFAFANVCGVYSVGFLIVLINYLLTSFLIPKSEIDLQPKKEWYASGKYRLLFALLLPATVFTISIIRVENQDRFSPRSLEAANSKTFVVAVQPNVPMSGLKYGEWEKLRERHIELAQDALQKLKEQKTNDEAQSTIVVFPESPMNFEYESDRELKSFLRDFAVRNNASVLFNSAQPNTHSTNLYNSAVIINAQGRKIAQYDKIHLVPFGETVPLPDALAQVVPTMVGNFETGENYNLFPLGDNVKGGVMICFESHFSSLAREYAREGADVLIEMTNDGYLGKTPILRQHLANAVFRAVETNRPVLRVTNVGITAYVNERGEVLDALDSYTPEARVWTVSKSDGNQTFYVRYGDWFAWLCSIVSLALLFWSLRKRLRDGNIKITEKKI